MADRGTVVITGASAGVGRATAHAFAQRGWNVALLARGVAGLEAARTEVEREGGAALVLPLDVADPEAVFRAAGQAAATFGAIDVWINAAMVTVLGEVAETTPEEFRRVTEVTYLGSVHGTLAALQHMRPRNHGTIVQVGSALAYRAIPMQAAYCAAKFAIRGFTDSLRSELIHAGSKVRLTMVQLPAVDTPQFDWARNHMPRRPRPVAPVFAPKAVAKHILRAAEEAPREFWVGGPAVQAILGNMVAPGLLDRMLATRAYAGQQADEPAQERPDNLFDPLPGDRGARGRFGNEARATVGGYDPALLRIGAALAGVGVLGGSWLLGRAIARDHRRGQRNTAATALRIMRSAR
ncbi:SDR family oxidoreductase [Falsiroseomonas sp. HC035]|uniref:SDR family oxidoreductase n=1 Tax=Falsiroseomonas sp. HC035 TaxID=3390999 RepID=UPI003D3208F5